MRKRHCSGIRICVSLVVAAAGLLFASCIEGEDCATLIEGCLGQSPKVSTACRPNRIRAACKPGDPRAWEVLRSTLLDSSADERNRYYALLLATAIADEGVSDQIVTILADFAREPDECDIEDVGEEELLVRFSLADRAACNELKELQAKTSDCSPAFELTKRLYERVRHPIEFNWCDVLDRCRGDAKQRRAFALTMLERDRSIVACAAAAAVVDEPMKATLRERVLATDDPMAFDYAAAATLAYLGDEELLPFLQSLRPKLASYATPNQVVHDCIAQIQWQNPPSRLLDLIASDHPDAPSRLRTWAIRRALELGTPRGAVRDAILQYANRVGPRRDSDKTAKINLLTMKRVGLRSGILDAWDLPGIRIRTRVAIP